MQPPLFVLVALAACAQALNPHRAEGVHRHPLAARNVSHVPRSRQYKPVDRFQGQNFFDGWSFFSDADPSGGLVNYQTRENAMNKHLAYVQSDNTAVLTVDSKSNIPVGAKRDSVRISTNKAYARGLFIADIWSMPHGCSVWPAYWTLGTGVDWPNGGEIDILEGVNEMGANQVTAHAGPGCTLDADAVGDDAVGRLISTTCSSTPTSNNGCSWDLRDPRSYGHEFNLQAGGVYAHTLEDDGISVWFFSRGSIPADINEGQPDPSTWGKPVAVFPATRCDIGSHFTPQQIVLDITLCGDWTNAVWGQSQCPGTCAQTVSQASSFQYAAWKINYIAVYQ